MADTDFELGDYKYVIGPMDVFDQADIAAKITPILPVFIEIVMADRKAADFAAAESDTVAERASMMDMLSKNFGKIASIVASMPKADRDAIFSQCLAVVKRQAPGAVGWAPIWNSQTHRMMFDDLNELRPMLTIVWHVISAKLGSFTSADPSF